MTQAPRPWTAGDAPATGARRHAPATLRNREAIVAVLRDALPSSGLMLEVASGSGEHAVCFAQAFPHLSWQPSDPDPAAQASIDMWRTDADLGNLMAPIALDAAALDWPVQRADAMLCINMLHISPWAATLGLMRGAGLMLPSGGLLYLYGPFVEAQTNTAPSNLAFDTSLRARDAAWGLRDVEDVTRAASVHGLLLDRRIAMPANNLSLLFRKA